MEDDFRRVPACLHIRLAVCALLSLKDLEQCPLGVLSHGVSAAGLGKCPELCGIAGSSSSSPRPPAQQPLFHSRPSERAHKPPPQPPHRSQITQALAPQFWTGQAPTFHPDTRSTLAAQTRAAQTLAAQPLIASLLILQVPLTQALTLQAVCTPKSWSYAGRLGTGPTLLR